MMETFQQDLRYSLRALLKRPGFTLVVALTLALSIGANTAIFTWINAVLLQPLPGIERPEELVEVWGATRNNSALSSSYLDYLDFRDRSEVFSGLVAHQVMPLNFGRGARPERVWGAVVSGNYFDALGVRVAIGRTFLPEEDGAPNTHPVAVISHGLWQRRFGGDPNVVGQTVTLNERDFTVIGVAPKEFGSTYSGVALDVWTPVMMKDYVARPHFSLTDRGSRWLMVMGRLRPGKTVAQAQANLAAIADQLSQSFPQTNEKLGVEVYSLTRSPYGIKRTLRPALAMLMAVVALVLLIACANIANLLLARATSRRKEIAIRMALGANRWRLVRQLLTESLALALLGGVSGLLLAYWTARSLSALLPPFGLAVSFDTSPDANVLGFTLAVTVITGLLFGLVPALQASKPDLVATLKDDVAAVGRVRRRFALRNLLVIAQVALSVLALVGAGLFVRSLWKAQRADPGFNPDGVVLASFDPFLNGYDETRGREFYRRLVERVEALPGMQSVTLARRLPLTLSGIAFANVTIEGYTPGRDEDMRINYETVGPKYFRTMGIQLARGRDFTERDNERAPGVVVINETIARRFWPGPNPPNLVDAAMGKRLKLGKDWLEIVGVAKEVKQRRLNEPPQPFLYLPLLQDYRSNMILVARTALEMRAAIQAVERVGATLDANMPIFDVKTMDDHIGVSLFLPRMAATLLSLFGLLALSLAAIGLYGVMSYSVNRRTREIGILISLGAQRRDVLRLVMGQELILSLIGIVIGLVAALGVTRLIAHLLFGVGASDPATFGLIALLLTGVALAACYLPARRATKVDPMIALRNEG